MNFAYCEPCVHLKILVACGEPVYLTKNGYGAMVVLSLEAYSRLTDGIEAALDMADKAAIFATVL